MRCGLRRCLLVVGLLYWGVTTGCVTVENLDETEPQHAPLMVVRSGDYALLSWDSELNREYAVLYTDGDRRFADWHPLKGAERIRGTGREIRIEDRLPVDRLRHYRLMVRN